MRNIIQLHMKYTKISSLEVVPFFNNVNTLDVD